MSKNNICVINPRSCKKFDMWVELHRDLSKDEIAIPWIRVFQDRACDIDDCAYIRLDKPDYFMKCLSAKMSFGQVERFLWWLNDPWSQQYTKSTLTEERKIATNYQAAVELWVEAYGETFHIERDSSGFIQIPDYRLLPSVFSSLDGDRSVIDLNFDYRRYI